MTASLIVPLAFASTGNGAWLAYAFGTVMLLFVAANLNQFTRRSSTSGSMYGYATEGLGPRVGGMAGWSLIWAYLFIGIAGLTGFTVFAGTLLDQAGLHIPAFILIVVCAVIGWGMAYRDVRLSAVTMLLLEAISVALILVLAVIVLGKHGFAPDTDQLTLKGMSFSGLGLGVVISIFSLVGFESATAFGEEAKNPLRSIPRAVILSLVLTGIFFVLMTYVEVLGVRGYKQTLDQIGLPLNVLANLNGAGFLVVPLEVGAMLSFFSLYLSCVNAGARVSYAMAKRRLFHNLVALAHDHNLTPHVAITAASVVTALVPLALVVIGNDALTIFGWVGSFGAFGFLGAYGLISAAAWGYLRKIGELKAKDVALSVAALALLLVPAVGSVYPVPPAPVNYFPYVFALYLLAGAAWIFGFRRDSHIAPVAADEEKMAVAAG
jgi:amino acid transporter